jgi:hypothetical protein
VSRQGAGGTVRARGSAVSAQMLSEEGQAGEATSVRPNVDVVVDVKVGVAGIVARMAHLPQGRRL